MSRRTRKRLLVAFVALGAFAAFVFFNNSSWLHGAPGGTPVLLAHRGLAQGFDRTGLTGDTCTASRMLPPEHPYLENTIASMRAAFDLGAGAVELDIQPTTDGRFAVFHDWTVDCRTEGHGVTREHSLAELQALDIGHGYTADGGETFPFRGQGHRADAVAGPGAGGLSRPPLPAQRQEQRPGGRGASGPVSRRPAGGSP